MSELVHVQVYSDTGREILCELIGTPADGDFNIADSSGDSVALCESGLTTADIDNLIVALKVFRERTLKTHEDDQC